MTPAAYHRIAEPGIVSRRFIHLASRLIASGMIPLAVGLTLDVILVVWISVAWLPAVLVGAALFLTFAILWFGYPLLKRRRSRRD